MIKEILKDLRIDFNPIRDVSPLVGLRYLESLNIQQTDIENLGPLLKLTNLKNLHQ